MTAAALDDAPAAGRNRALAFLSASVVLSMTTWFSASAVVPQLREDWVLGGPAAAWLTIAVQLGFVLGATLSSILNLADVVSPRVVLLAGATRAAGAKLALAAAGRPPRRPRPWRLRRRTARRPRSRSASRPASSSPGCIRPRSS